MHHYFDIKWNKMSVNDHGDNKNLNTWNKNEMNYTKTYLQFFTSIYLQSIENNHKTQKKHLEY